MNDHQRLIGKKLDHLRRMREYLNFSLQRVSVLMPIQSWEALHPENHEALAAFRVRFSEFQEHLGKLMRAIAMEEEQPVEPFSAVLLYMEKLNIIDAVETWKDIRELRNAINHEYEEGSARLSGFFLELTRRVPTLLDYHDRAEGFLQYQLSAPFYLTHQPHPLKLGPLPPHDPRRSHRHHFSP